MAHPLLEPKQMTEDTRKLTEMVADEDLTKRYNQVHFGFNGAPPEGFSGRIMLRPDKHTNNQKVKSELKKFAHGHRARRLWTIVLKYPIDHWDNLMTWAKTNELVFDAMLYSSRTGRHIHRSFFHSFMTRDESCKYELRRDCFKGDARLYFKEGGIKVVKKESEVVVVVKLLESGFYECYHYVVVDPQNPQAGEVKTNSK